MVATRVRPTGPFNRQIDFLAIRKFQIALVNNSTTAFNNITGSDRKPPRQLLDLGICD